MSEFGALRCSDCGLSWPLDNQYANCKQCGEKCDPVSNIRPMPLDEAKSLAAHLDFERYYEKRGSRPSLRIGEFNDRFTLDGWKHEIKMSDLAKHRKTSTSDAPSTGSISPSGIGRSHSPSAA